MISAVIEQCLRDYPETRDSDRKLLVKVWEHYGLYLSPHQYNKLMDIPSSETVRRVRQKFQEQGKYLADESVRASRRIKSQIIQQNAPTIKPEKMDNMLDLGVEPIKNMHPAEKEWLGRRMRRI